MARVLEWDLRDLLCAFAACRKARLRTEYRHAELFWALTAPHCKTTPRKPEPPELIRDEYA